MGRQRAGEIAKWNGETNDRVWGGKEKVKITKSMGRRRRNKQKKVGARENKYIITNERSKTQNDYLRKKLFKFKFYLYLTI